MSVLIKGAKMPRLCRECACVQPSFSGTGYFCAADELLVRDVILNDVPPDWCPLVEVPTPHGRLIDADRLDAVVLELIKSGFVITRSEYKRIASVLFEFSTIIEAEEEPR